MKALRTILAIFLILATIMPMVPVQSQSTGSDWWNLGWQARRPIDIMYPGPGPLFDYQVNVTISIASNMRPDLADLRFVQRLNGQQRELPYWIQEGGNASRTVVWVKVAEIVPPVTRMFMYYNNSGARAASNGSATFEFFDDFTTNTSGRFYATKWAHPEGNHHCYYYYDRSTYQGEDTLSVPGRMTWSMKMTKYQVSNWGTAHWWAMRNQTWDKYMANETNYVELGIYANTDVSANGEHPAMMLSAWNGTGSSQSSNRPRVDINLNQDYTYSLAASDNVSTASVATKDGTVLFNPSLPVMPNQTRFLHIGDFVGIQYDFGISNLGWDGSSHLVLYTSTEHVTSWMEFYIDHVFHTKYVTPEPAYVMFAEEYRPLTPLELSAGFGGGPTCTRPGEPMNLTAVMVNPGTVALNVTVSISVVAPGGDYANSTIIDSAVIHLPPSQEVVFGANWSAVPGPWRFWCAIDGVGVRFVEMTINRPPVLDPVQDIWVQENRTVAWDVYANDSDGDPLTWNVNGTGITVTPKDNRSATLKFPASREIGMRRYNVTVTDYCNCTVSRSFNLTVENLNDPPRAAIVSPKDGDEFKEGEAITFIGSGEDDDIPYGDALTLTWYADGIHFGDGTQFTTDVLSEGKHAITLNVTDRWGETMKVSITISIGKHKNHKPENVTILEPKDGAEFLKDEMITFSGTADDPDGDALTYSWYVDGLGAGFGEKVSMLLTLGTHNVKLVASDGSADASATISIIVIEPMSGKVTVAIDSPKEGAVFNSTDDIHFRGFSGAGNLAVEVPVTWYVDGDIVSTTKEFTMKLGPGKHLIKLVGTLGGDSAEESVNITVIDTDGGGGDVPEVTLESDCLRPVIVLIVAGVALAVGLLWWRRKAGEGER